MTTATATQNDIAGITLSEVKIWPTRNREGSRVKAMASVTLNDALRINGLRIIEGSKGLFLSFPSEKKAGTDQYFPIVHTMNRELQEGLQEALIARFNDLVD